MQTPIFDFVQQYQQGGTVRFHMPGHKGQAFLGCEPFDITEIAGADDLQHPDQGGIIAQSEQNATSLFGTAQTCYCAGGSSACISAMLYLATCAAPAARKGRIVAGRNAHKVFLQACGLLGLQPIWLYPSPEQGQGICGCEITPTALAKALQAQQVQDELPMAVYITSPDYLGNVADVAGLAAVCKQYDVPLLVDNAHGAYLKFVSPSQHPMDLGAAMCCDSAHKTLPVLTGGAYLHLAAKNPDAKSAISLFSSTSPSYLILQSLDLCNAYLADGYEAVLSQWMLQMEQCKQALLAHGYHICNTEPLKLVIDCRAMQMVLQTSGMQTGVLASKQKCPLTGAVDGTQNDAVSGNSDGVMDDAIDSKKDNPLDGTPDNTTPLLQIQGGEALADYLRANGIEPEFADPDFVVCMMTPQNTVQELERLCKVLTALVVIPQPKTQSRTQPKQQPTIQNQTLLTKGAYGIQQETLFFVPHQTSCTIRDAIFSQGEAIAVENSVGRTCRVASVACPPAIPIVVSGEVITNSDVKLFQYYGIETVNVIKEE